MFETTKMSASRSVVLISLIALQTSCVERSPPWVAYVCTGARQAPDFMPELDSILKDNGFEPSRGRAVDGRGRTTFVLEAEKDFVRVWSQNALIERPKAMPELESDRDPGSYPDRYYLSAQAQIPSARSRARETLEAIRQALARRGFVDCAREA